MFLHLVLSQLAFSRSLGKSLRFKQNIFSSIDQFFSHLLSDIANKSLDFELLTSLYKSMNPAIHSKINESTLDTSAWAYAVGRLPQNITSVNMILFSTKMIQVIGGSSIKTGARRRSTFQLMPGKIFVLLRDLVSDITDFVTNLCLHTIETRKLRAKIGEGEGIAILFRQLKEIRAGKVETLEMKRTVLDAFPNLTEGEKIGLISLWPHNLIENVFNIMYQYGDYKLIISSGIERYDEDISERWTQKVLSGALDLLDLEHWLENDISVDIISSNTHSVSNILSPFLHSKRQEILEWGRLNKAELIKNTPVSEQDLLYILSQYYMKEHPHLVDERTQMEKQHGFVTIIEQELTGVTVQLFDPSKLSREFHDDYIKISTPINKRHLIVNIDFCFGRYICITLGKLKIFSVG